MSCNIIKPSDSETIFVCSEEEISKEDIKLACERLEQIWKDEFGEEEQDGI